AGNHFKSIYMPSKNGEFGGFFKILNSVALEIIFAKKMWVKERLKVPDPLGPIPLYEPLERFNVALRSYFLQ
ncbi:MAG: hypothetical protein JWQ35_989, partial [Bacteriovoracaceae bacterium]|nr:hypothetical protein [Bacteriovoracaceae bacterium]